MTALSTRDALTQALAEHWDVEGDSTGFACSCGYSLGDGSGDLDGRHRVHVAESLPIIDVATLADELRSMGAIWGGDSMWVTTGTKVADLMAETIATALTERTR